MEISGICTKTKEKNQKKARIVVNFNVFRDMLKFFLTIFERSVILIVCIGNQEDLSAHKMYHKYSLKGSVENEKKSVCAYSFPLLNSLFVYSHIYYV